MVLFRFATLIRGLLRKLSFHPTRRLREPIDDFPTVDELLYPSDGHPAALVCRYAAMIQVKNGCLTGFFAYLQSGHGPQRDVFCNTDLF